MLQTKDNILTGNASSVNVVNNCVQQCVNCMHFLGLIQPASFIRCVCGHVQEMIVDIPEGSRTELEKCVFCMINHRPDMLTNYARQKFQCKFGPPHSNYGGINCVSTKLIVTEDAHSEDQQPN